MNKTKIGSLALSAVFLGTTVLGFAGCKKGAGKVKEVPKDAPWYDVKVTTFDTPQGTSSEGYSYYGDYVICDNDIVTSYYSYDEVTYDSMSYIIDYDMEGNIKSQIYIRDLFEDPKNTTAKKDPVDESMKEIEGTTDEEAPDPDCFVTDDGDTRYYEVRNIFKDGDGFGAFLSYYDYSGMDYSEHYFIYSSKDGSVRELNSLSTIVGNNGWFSSIFGMGNGELGVILENWNEKTYESEYSLIILKDDSVKSQTALSDLLKDDKINYVESATYKDGKIVLSCFTDNGGTARYSIDPDSKEVTKDESVSGSYYNTNVADNGIEYYVNESGVFEVKAEDDKSEEKTPVLSFDDCNILRSDVWGMKVISMSDTECTMFGSMYDSGSDKSYFKMYEFTKAESNPNAGEKIINVGYTDYMSNGIYKAIYEFNEKSDEYFITITDVYANTDDLEELWNGGGDEDDEDRYRKAYNEHNSKLMDKLSVDLLAGDAPDIIFGTHPYIQLKDEKFLVDLMPKIEEEIGVDAFFPNVIDGTKTGDKLYSMPLSFEVTGIMADIKAAGDKEGFTFKEYSTFVKDVCNGKDPVGTYMTRMEYFQQVFGTMADLYYDKDGNINLQTEAFYELAEYCKDNVPESFDEEAYYEDDYDYGCYGENTKADTAYLYNINSYLDFAYDSKGSKVKDLYGYPSYDGRGAVVQVDVSVSISAMSAVQDGAWGFVKSLLEESVQKDMGIENYTNPINVAACEAVALKTVKDNNEMAEKYIKEDPQAAQWYRVYKESVVDDYIDALKSATSSNTIDPAIITIVDEEIQAYFAGQKSIEEVTETIQNRAQTLINERKA
ncbi:MAG: carbohydrate ABC transporter substrate-binding protein [Clostridiales bacterium]|nr:carbohydrate ABC transporter substrate-binding protein [Clostridiales bacterium]